VTASRPNEPEAVYCHQSGRHPKRPEITGWRIRQSHLRAIRSRPSASIRNCRFGGNNGQMISGNIRLIIDTTRWFADRAVGRQGRGETKKPLGRSVSLIETLRAK